MSGPATGPNRPGSAFPAHAGLWDLHHGGDRRQLIAEAMAGAELDLVVLTEYRRADGLGSLRAAFSRGPLRYLADSRPRPGANGVLVASREPLADLPLPPSQEVARVMAVSWQGIPLVVVSAPSTKGDPQRRHAAAARLEQALDLAGDGALLAGTFKVRGSPEDCPFTVLLRRLEHNGWTGGPLGRSTQFWAGPSARVTAGHPDVVWRVAGRVLAIPDGSNADTVGPRSAPLADHPLYRWQLTPVTRQA